VPSTVPQLLLQFLDVLPAISGCCSESGNVGLAIQAYELVRTHMPSDEQQYAEVRHVPAPTFFKQVFVIQEHEEQYCAIL
jgi:hypothetical protein